MVGGDTSKGDATCEKVVKDENGCRPECGGGSDDRKGRS